MKLQLCLVFLFLSLKGSYSTISSYRSPGDRWSYLCGCASRNQLNTSIQMKCKENEVIQMEPRRHSMRESVDSSNDDCGQFNFTTCTDFRPKILDLENRIEIYKKCFLKNSCDINIAGVEEGNQRFINYPFYCYPVSSLLDISVKRDINISMNRDTIFPIFYLIGEHHTGQKIDCDCVVTGPDVFQIYIYFIHLKPTSCSKVKFLSRNVQMFGCSTNDTTMLHAGHFDKFSEFKLEIRDMEPDKEDVLFFTIAGPRISVNCTRCTKSKGFQATDLPNTDKPATDVPATEPATDIPATDIQNTDIPVTTDSATGCSISTGNTDHSNNDNYPALFGGVIASIMVINILGIGIFCLIRKRKKPKNVPNEPIPTVSSSNDYADFHHPIGTDNHHYQELMDYQNVTRQDTPTGPESH